MSAASRSPTPELPPCPRCAEPATPGRRYCVKCGDRLPATCVACRRPVAAGDPRCLACGAEQPVDTLAGPEVRTWDVLLRRLREQLAGEFRIDRELGRGGQAAVYLAYETALRRSVAIKVLSSATLHDAFAVDRFRSEARIVAGLRHPNIVEIFDVRSGNGLHFFIMQYLPGDSLAEILTREGALAPDLVLPIVRQIGTALDFAHANGVIHRDVKPANVLFDAEGNAVVTDFGIARQVEGSGTTSQVAPVGTPAFMSPEQCRSEPVGPASDQYALGVLTYNLLTGELPFVASSNLGLMQAQVQAPIPSAREVNPAVPPAMDATIRRMLAKSPGDRWPTLRAAIEALGPKPVGGSATGVRQVLKRLAQVPDGTPSGGFPRVEGAADARVQSVATPAASAEVITQPVDGLPELAPIDASQVEPPAAAPLRDPSPARPPLAPPPVALPLEAPQREQRQSASDARARSLVSALSTTTLRRPALWAAIVPVALLVAWLVLRDPSTASQAGSSTDSPVVDATDSDPKGADSESVAVAKGPDSTRLADTLVARSVPPLTELVRGETRNLQDDGLDVRRGNERAQTGWRVKVDPQDLASTLFASSNPGMLTAGQPGEGTITILDQRNRQLAQWTLRVRPREDTAPRVNTNILDSSAASATAPAFPRGGRETAREDVAPALRYWRDAERELRRLLNDRDATLLISKHDNGDMARERLRSTIDFLQQHSGALVRSPIDVGMAPKLRQESGVWERVVAFPISSQPERSLQAMIQLQANDPTQWAFRVTAAP
jgi:eukaryotic-like serine/threonine-protein kinase